MPCPVHNMLTVKTHLGDNWRESQSSVEEILSLPLAVGTALCL